MLTGHCISNLREAKGGTAFLTPIFLHAASQRVGDMVTLEIRSEL